MASPLKDKRDDLDYHGGNYQEGNKDEGLPSLRAIIVQLCIEDDAKQKKKKNGWIDLTLPV
jgi:hypothetical protein